MQGLEVKLGNLILKGENIANLIPYFILLAKFLFSAENKFRVSCVIWENLKQRE